MVGIQLECLPEVRNVMATIRYAIMHKAVRFQAAKLSWDKLHSMQARQRLYHKQLASSGTENSAHSGVTIDWRGGAIKAPKSYIFSLRSPEPQRPSAQASP